MRSDPSGFSATLQTTGADVSASDRSQPTPVTVGLRSTTTAEVRTGLTSGDRVILFPSDQVRDGGRVVVRTTRAVSGR